MVSPTVIIFSPRQNLRLHPKDNINYSSDKNGFGLFNIHLKAAKGSN